MSRFNNPKALTSLLSRSNVPATAVAAEQPHAFANETFRPVTLPDRVFDTGSEAVPNMLQILCFFVVNVYLLSGAANDFIFHFTHGKTYISATCVILLPLLFFGTGTSLRGLQAPAGRWFAGFVAWLVFATPFSVWKGGSANLLLNYVPRAFLVCFYLAACVVTVRQIRIVIRVMGVCALSVILSCYAFGGFTDGRFAIPDSLFFSNANLLALQLLLGIIVLMYPFFEAGKFAKFVSAVGIFVSLSYMLKTGSRGVMIATLLTGFVVFILSRQRITVLLLAVPALVLAFVLAPSDMQHRVTLILIDPMNASAQDAESSAVGSQMQRQKLLKTSIFLAVTNPLFGVGPGQFAVKVAGEQEKKGEHADWLGTHNSYTQVASEAGLPALIFYVATIVTCMRVNYRLYQRSKGRPGLEQIAGISFCLFLSIFAYSIGIFFFHEAYDLQLSVLAGVSICLYLTVTPVLERYEKSTVLLGSGPQHV